MRNVLLLAAALLVGWTLPARATTMFYGDQDLLGTGTYPSDPTAGASLEGLAPGVTTKADLRTFHSWPFSPSPTDFPGTDQIYVGSVQIGDTDGYSRADERLNGPATFNLDYSALIPAGQIVESLTLGLAPDDFEFHLWGNPYTAWVNGLEDAALSAALNSLMQGPGPFVEFFTIGIEPSILNSSHNLMLVIDEGGDGNEGWAIDFLSVGVTTIPEPGTFALLALSVAGVAVMRSRSQRGAI